MSPRPGVPARAHHAEVSPQTESRPGGGPGHGAEPRGVSWSRAGGPQVWPNVPPHSSSHNTGSAGLSQAHRGQQVNQGQAQRGQGQPGLHIGQPSLVQAQPGSSRSAQGQPGSAGVSLNGTQCGVDQLARETQGIPRLGPLGQAMVRVRVTPFLSFLHLGTFRKEPSPRRHVVTVEPRPGRTEAQVSQAQPVWLHG